MEEERPDSETARERSEYQLPMKRILLLSDLHVGSKYGLWPPNFSAENPRTDEIESYPQNNVNKAIWAHWLTMLKVLKKDKPDCIILNGDLIEGTQDKEKGRGLVTPEISVQVKACLKVLKTLPNVPMYFTAGTDYHQMSGGESADLHIAEAMGGKYGDELIVNACGIRLFCRHTISSSMSTWQYMATAPGRDHMLLYLNKSPEKYGKIDFAVFSHRHQFVCVQFSSGFAIVTPGWQSTTRYAVKKGITGLPEIGWVVLHVESPHKITVDTSGVACVVRPCKEVG